jgi:hypothetical protein
MSEPCPVPVPFEALADYLSGSLVEAEESELEAHLFECESCSRAAESLAGLLSVVSAAVAPVLSATRFETLERAGRIETVRTMTPGEKTDVEYPTPGRLLVIRLEGADLTRASRVDVHLENTKGQSIARMESVPFDPSQGEVILACQAHYAELFPEDSVFTIETVAGEKREEAARYTVIHHPRA